ncbi:MAG: hypothetical protein K2M74_04035, partial [Bacteroidales bacterium]|nr:hypothetical protein [Bacteroidales bacterium]
NMDEIDVVTKSIAQRTETEADMIWGAGEDASAGENLNITLIATGFEEKKVMGIREKTIINLNEKTYTAPAVAPAPAPIMSASTPAPAPVAEIPQTEAKEPEKKEVVGILSFDGEVSSAQVEAPSAQVSELKSASAEAPAMAVSEPTVAEDPLIEEVKAESELWMNDIDIFANVESIATEQKVASVEETAEVTMSEQEQSETVEVEEGFTMEIHTEAQQEMGSETMHQETVTTVMEASEQVQPTNAIRERYAATAERMMHLRQMSQKIKTQQGLREIESIPAYQRQNLDLTPVVPSDVSEVSTTSIGRDGSLFSSNPPFLTDKAD